MMLTTIRRSSVRRRSAFTLIEVLVVVAIIVILATIAAVAVPKQMNEAKKGTAVTGCSTIAKAVDSYVLSASNPGISDEERLPTDLTLLANPGWTTPFLEQSQLLDPWGKQYQWKQGYKEDGVTPSFIVYTIAPDNTPISQHGAGARSRVSQ